MVSDSSPGNKGELLVKVYWLCGVNCWVFLGLFWETRWILLTKTANSSSENCHGLRRRPRNEGCLVYLMVL